LLCRSGSRSPIGTDAAVASARHRTPAMAAGARGCGPSSVSTLHILVVDDEPFIRDTLSMLLSLEGHTVVSAADGVAGLQMARQLQPDLILTDRSMPNLNGDGLLAAVRGDAALARTRVVLLTGDTSTAVFEGNGVDPQADGCLTKPFTRAQLLAVLSAAMAG
jgi:CheY-like chemotaxis protein